MRESTLLTSLAVLSGTACAWMGDSTVSRRQALDWLAGGAAASLSVVASPSTAQAVAEQPDATNVDEFLRSGT